MRHAIAWLLVALPAAQDREEPGDVSFGFAVEQGWGLAVPFEAD